MLTNLALLLIYSMHEESIRLKTFINEVLQIPVFLMMIVSSIKESMLLVDCPLRPSGALVRRYFKPKNG